MRPRLQKISLKNDVFQRFKGRGPRLAPRSLYLFTFFLSLASNDKFIKQREKF